MNLHVITGGDYNSSKPLIFFVHGFPECWSTWQSQMVYFARLGYPVAAMDMRGFGLSSAPADAGAYAMRTLVGDVVKVLSKLRTNGDSSASSHGSAERARNVVLCGHDWGGVVAWNLAFLEHNDEVKSISKMVIANAPHPSVDALLLPAAQISQLGTAPHMLGDESTSSQRLVHFLNLLAFVLDVMRLVCAAADSCRTRSIMTVCSSFDLGTWSVHKPNYFCALHRLSSRHR